MARKTGSRVAPSGGRRSAGGRAAPGAGRAAAVLCFIFFLSGVSALLFETLWFQLAGLSFGNSVWASSLVLASFMGGLALGNGLAARHGDRIRNAVVVYARLEALIAVTGLMLVLVLPHLGGWLAPLLGPLLDRPWLINPLRLLIAFLLLLVPTTAMGMTLPLMVKALFREDPHFGRTLGRLYGWNTLGAVAGALAGELLLIEWIGLRGTGYVAAGLDLIAAGVALAFAHGRQASASALPAVTRPAGAISSRSARLLAGSFLAGGILLAFEVVWFRFLQLSVIGTSFSFAIMLATVLAGIGLGGILAAWWLRVQPGASEHLAIVALISGSTAVLAYRLFTPPEVALSGRLVQGFDIARLVLVVSFPVALLSGILFTLFGEAAQKELAVETRTAGLLTLANTTGAMLGSLAGGFVLLPVLGLERSFFVLSSAYVAVAICAMEPGRWRGWRNAIFSGLLLLLLVTFPFGSMNAHLAVASRPYRERFKAETVAVREGLTETVQYLRRDFHGEPLDFRLMTNAYSMSGTALDSKRYMRLYVYWPAAVHPALRHALLIGFGAGTTAKALTSNRSLATIDVVDISRDILELGSVVYPDAAENPLEDPRVQTHVEDGRYFLQTTNRRFDLITAEPPPPGVGSAVNLYTEEYFELIHDRLAEGGIVTYWLPVYQITAPASRSILAAFCNVFEDCSLWAGVKYDWMMVGTRHAAGPVSEEQFVRQWSDPATASEMRAVGLEVPEQLGTTLIADSRRLATIVDGAAPLVDNHPRRLSLEQGGVEDERIYDRWMNLSEIQNNFASSPGIEKLWPQALRARTLDYFRYQRVANMQVFPDDPRVLELIDALQSRGLTSVALWLMNSTADHGRIIDKLRAHGSRENFDPHLGARAFAQGEFDLAASYFGRQPQSRPTLTEPLRILALCKAGRSSEARQLADRFTATHGRPLNYSCW